MSIGQATVALREDESLTRLKLRLNVPANAPPSCDGYLLRFLRNKELNVDESISKLGRRREFERTLPSLSITPHIVASLRSRALSVIGSDILHRPVLYLRLGLHRAGDSASEEKLAIVVLEYLQSLVTKSNVHEFALLLNEEGTGWFTSHNSPLKQRLAVLLQKYYPELVGLILVVNASWTVTQGLKQSVKSSNKYRRRIEIISPKELQKYIDASVIPGELGGRNNLQGPAAANAATDFSEAVLRYWYAMTMAVRRDEGTGSLKFPWMPLASVVDAASGGSSASPINRHLRSSQPSVSQGQRRQGSLAPDDTSSYDDGRCSVIADEDTGGALTGPEEVALHERVPSTIFPEGGSGSDELSALKRQLAFEQQRRREVEAQVARLQLGVPVSDSTLTCLEASLRVMHEEVNRLVGEAIVVSRTKFQGEASLVQLVEMTDNALIQVIQEKPTVPAMKYSTPVDRKLPSKCVCS